MSHMSWASITAILRLIFEYCEYAQAGRLTEKAANIKRPGFVIKYKSSLGPFLKPKMPSPSDLERSRFRQSTQHRNGVCCEAWLWWHCLGNQTHSLTPSCVCLRGIPNTYALWGIVPRVPPATIRSWPEEGKTECVWITLCQVPAKAKWRSSSSPTISFPVPHYTLNDDGKPQKFLSVWEISINITMLEIKMENV